MSQKIRTFGGDNESELSKFADAFMLPSLDAMPRSLSTALDYCRVLYHRTPAYRAGIKHLVGHFVTELTYRGDVGSPDERKDFSERFKEEYLGLLALNLLGENWGAYGNGFIRVHFPFVRQLVDRRNDIATYSPSMFPEELIKFDLQTMTYKVPDPRRSDLSMDKRPKIDLPFRDTQTKDFSKISFELLDPRYARLRYCEWSGSSIVQYQFSPEFRSKINKGELHSINDTPQDVLYTIRNKQDYLFDKDAVYHLKNQTIAGVSNEGWGLPEILAHYTTIHKIAVYDRIDESLGLDYMQPFRLVVPNLQGVGDSAAFALSKEWMPAINRMFKEQRLDRTKIHSFPFPSVLQEFGGQGKALTPKELKEYEVGQLLTGLGIPLELLQGSLSVQATPFMIRMMESAHPGLSQGLANAARWMAGKVSRFMFGESFNCTLSSSRVANDIEKRSLLFNLFSAGEIPRSKAFDGLDLDDPTKLKVERAEEDLQIQEDLAIKQEEAKRRSEMGSLDAVLDASSGGGPSGPGGGGGGGGGQVVTPTDLRGKGEQLAQEWMSIPTDGQRSQEMQKVRATDPDLYAVAKDAMEKMKAQGASQGSQMVMQQAQEQAGQTA
jgi:hypothetical protein